MAVLFIQLLTDAYLLPNPHEVCQEQMPICRFHSWRYRGARALQPIYEFIDVSDDQSSLSEIRKTLTDSETRGTAKGDFPVHRFSGTGTVG